MSKHTLSPHAQFGMTTLEVVIGVSIAGLVFVYVMNSILLFINSARDATERTQALYLATDGIELVRFARDTDWNTFQALSLATPYYLQVTGTTVTITTSPETIGDFTREFTSDAVYRDTTTDDIVASTTMGSVADPESKYVTVRVGWGSAGKEVSLTTILTNLDP